MSDKACLAEDKICDFLDRCWGAGIKDPVAYLISKRPQVYDWLKGVFPRGILPTDIDGEVELNGQFLRLEFKHENAMRNGYMSRGQLIALDRLAKTGFFTVFIIGLSEYSEPSCIIIYYPNGKIADIQDADREMIRTKCKAWANWVQTRPVFTQQG